MGHNRGNFNLDYSEGFKIERERFKLLKSTMMNVLGASQLEETSRTLIDLACGIDAYAEIQGNVYGISLRVRDKDYNSFTLSRHIDDVNSEVRKWTNQRKTKIKPAYHIQCNKVSDNQYTVFRINIDAFAVWLKIQIRDSHLEDFYNHQLMAYEFNYEKIKNLDGVSKFTRYS